MVEMTVVYKGEKHCELRHGPSGTMIETDAPRDNQGRGESFSPTDLMGASLASCILTTIAIAAEKEGINLNGTTAKVQKEMHPSPRRVKALPVEVTLPSHLNVDQRKRMEEIAKNCPVARSLNPEITAPITFKYI